jgi:hypothetical protein
VVFAAPRTCKMIIIVKQRGIHVEPQNILFFLFIYTNRATNTKSNTSHEVWWCRETNPESLDL